MTSKYINRLICNRAAIPVPEHSREPNPIGSSLAPVLKILKKCAPPVYNDSDAPMEILSSASYMSMYLIPFAIQSVLIKVVFYHSV